MNDPRPAVLVLMGGPDAEREISVLSGRAVAQALRDSNRFDVIERTIERPTASELSALGGDVVFPVLHGPWGEGGAVQELLETIALPYVGSPPLAAALAMDKIAGKEAVVARGVRAPASWRLAPDAPCSLDPPIVLKPIDDGSSVDLFICRTAEEIAAARRALHPNRGEVMAEVYVEGREITVGIVDGEPLPLIEIIPSDAVDFYDYQAKYFRDDTRYVIDPPLPPAVADECVRAASVAFACLGCRDIARADFIVDALGPWFLEINTMPGFTSHSLVPMAAAGTGLDMPALCAKLVDAALARALQPLPS